MAIHFLLLRKWGGALLAGLLLLAAGALAASKTIPVYTYYDSPPFVTGEHSGLHSELVAYLNSQANGRYHFKAEAMPRKRLDLLILGDNWPGVVAWAYPPFFQDQQRQRFLWSSPYLTDHDYLISLRSKPVDYRDANSLTGKRFGAVRGHRYPQLDELIDNGQIIRDDGKDEESNVNKLYFGRVDATLVIGSALNYYRHRYSWFGNTVFVATTPVSTFSRHFFVAPGNQALMRFLESVIQGMPNDPAWQQMVHGW
jgi:polar amino acid transport system substrate-binding protein